MEYGKYLEKIRIEHNISQTELATKIGTSHQNINRWERNLVLPNIHFCVKLADFYGISVDELIGHEVKKNW